MAVEAVRPRPSAGRALPRTWWIEPGLTVISYTAFLIYATWAVFFGSKNSFVDPYLSPFFSPRFGFVKLPFGLALPILAAIPLGLRASCYYYRKSYFRSFFWDPPACAIQELRRGRYRGETRFPWVLNNYHRYFLLATIVVVAFLWTDAVRAFFDHGRLFIGVGSLVMLVNVILLSLYTVTCHSFRYLMGGRLDVFSRIKVGMLWYRVTVLLQRLNPRHGAWAWYSMFSVALTDLYIRLAGSGAVHDLRWFL